LEAALARVDRALAADPAARAPRLERAGLLHQLGRTDDAKQAYLAILAQDPTDLDALTQFGALLRDTDYRSAACTVFRQAILHHPRRAVGPVLLGNTLLDQGDYPGARAQFQEALALDPGCREAHQGMATALMELREEELAWEHGRKGFTGRAHLTNPFRGSGQPVSVLVLNSAAGGNIPLRRNLDDQLFQSTMLLAEFHDPAAPLPPHQLAFNAIGDADYCQRGLDAAAALLRHSRAPLINAPAAVARTGRAENARRLAGIPGLVTPRTVMLTRAALAAADAEQRLRAEGLAFPLLVRSLGFQAGKHFVKVESPQGLAEALAGLPGRDFAAIEFLDARDADGRIRKYRVMMIDGRLYPLHAAVSSNWKIHYFSADMADTPAHRAEDEAFLQDMPRVLGAAALAALQGVQAALGLDYAGVDFSLGADGQVLLFEANATMVILPPGPGEAWAYRREPVQRVLDALTAMLLARAKAPR
jgi:tetratricopeptide (TPR) repeat protein